MRGRKLIETMLCENGDVVFFFSGDELCENAHLGSSKS